MSKKRATWFRLLEAEQGFGWGRLINIAIMGLIVVNVLAVVLASVDEINRAHERLFWRLELVSVIIFTLEFSARVWVCVEDPRYRRPLVGRLRYLATPMALIDLAAILPFYLGMFVKLDMRFLRALRLLRAFKLTRHSTAMDVLLTVMRKEAPSFASAVFMMVIVIIIAASGIYLIERVNQPEAFGSIPRAIWWATVTLTTVGYGDVVPVSTLGKLFGIVITIAGVGMVALPAGIIASGFSRELHQRHERYRLKLAHALADGTISAEDRRQLERKRDELGLSEGDASLMLSTAREALAKRGIARCPHCGGALDVDSG